MPRKKKKSPADGYGAASDSFLTRTRRDTMLRDSGKIMLDQATLITRSDLLEHIERFRHDKDEEARNYIVAHNLRLVRSIARRFVRPGIELDDLMTHGIFGLFRAVEKFDPDLGIEFSTYATPSIRRSIRRGVLNEEHVIRQSPYQRKLYGPLTEFVAKFRLEHGLDPTIDEIARGLDVLPDRIRDYFLSQNSQNVRSRHVAKPGSDDVDTFAMADASTHTPQETLITREGISSACAGCERYIKLFAGLDIPVRTRELAERWFGIGGHPLGQTLTEVSVAMDIRVDWARQNIKSIARYMKRYSPEWKDPRWLKRQLILIDMIDTRA